MGEGRKTVFVPRCFFFLSEGYFTLLCFALHCIACRCSAVSSGASPYPCPCPCRFCALAPSIEHALLLSTRLQRAPLWFRVGGCGLDVHTHTPMYYTLLWTYIYSYCIHSPARMSCYPGHDIFPSPLPLPVKAVGPIKPIKKGERKTRDLSRSRSTRAKGNVSTRGK